MPLLVFNKTAAAVALAAGNPVRTIPLSAAPPARGPAVNVTGELRPDTTVDPVNGVTGGLLAADFVLLQAQVVAGDLEYEWTADPEYLTGALVISGPSAGPHAASHLPGAADALATAAAVAVGDANAEGVAASFARSDHVHQLGATAGGDLTGTYPNPTVTTSVLEPVNDAVADGAGLSCLHVVRAAFAAGGGGAPDDVLLYNADTPFKFRILDSIVMVTTAVGGSTVQLQDAAGGAGTPLSMLYSSAAQALLRDDGTGTTYTTTALAAGSTIALRRSDSGVAGEVILFVRPEA